VDGHRRQGSAAPYRDSSPAICAFGEKVLTSGIKEHMIEGVHVRVYNPPKPWLICFAIGGVPEGGIKKAPALISRLKV